MMARETRLSVVALAAVLLLAGCADADRRPGEIFGTGIGGVVGGLVGSQFGAGAGQAVATGLGVAVGATAGNALGRAQDRAEGRGPAGGLALAAVPAAEGTAETAAGRGAISSAAPGRVPLGTVRPVAEPPGAGPCREFQQTVTIGGRAEPAYGTACRQVDGSWRFVR